MTDVPDGSVVITPQKMYDEQQAIRLVVERIANTIDPALSDLRGDVATLYAARTALTKEVQSVGNRTTVIETKLNAVWAVVGLLVAALGVVAAVVVR